MTSPIAPLCVACKHFRESVPGPGLYCAAYPDGDGIPEAIYMSRVDHRRPYDGDHGIQYAPAPGQEQWAQEWEAEAMREVS